MSDPNADSHADADAFAHALALARAREAVVRSQNPSVSALQRHLSLGYGEACALIDTLQRERVLLAPWPGRQPGLHPDYRRVHVRSVRGDARLNYIERIVQLALYFFELAEEDADADARAVAAQLPGARLDWAEVGACFRERWYGGARLPLTEAALAFHDWACARGAGPAGLDAADGGLRAGIRAGCLPYERRFAPVRDERARRERAYVRLARFYRRMLREDLGRHARVADWLVPPALAPQAGAAPGRHPELAVPCVTMRGLACACFEDHWSVRDVAALLRRWLVVVWIDDEDRRLLSQGVHQGAERMPDDWDAARACVYARLHARGIAFTPPASHPCTCGAPAQA